MSNAATAEPVTAAPRIPHGRRYELWVGAFVLAGLVAVLVTLFTLTSPSALRGRYPVTARVPDASGIRRGDPVQLRGVRIGQVRAFVIGPQGVDVHMDIEDEYRIPADSRIELRSFGLLGEMVADVVPGTSEAFAEPGAALPGSLAGGPFKVLDDIAQQAKGALQGVEKLVGPETVDNIQAGSVELNAALQELSALATEQRQEIGRLVASLQRSARGVEGAVGGPELARTVRRLDALSARLDAASGSLERSARSAETVLARIERGEGSLGKLARDETLYRNVSQAAASLNGAARSFTELAADIRREPGRYLKLQVF